MKAAKASLAEGDMAATIDILLTYYDKYYLGSIDKKKGRVKYELDWDGKSSENFAKTLIKTGY